MGFPCLHEYVHETIILYTTKANAARAVLFTAFLSNVFDDVVDTRSPCVSWLVV